VAILCLAVGLGVGFLICWFCMRGLFDKVGGGQEEEEKRELSARPQQSSASETAQQEPPVTGAVAAKAEDGSGTDHSDVLSDREDGPDFGSSGGEAGAPEVKDSGTGSDAGKPAATLDALPGSSSDAPAESGAQKPPPSPGTDRKTQKRDGAEAEEVVRVVEMEPVRIVSALGGKANLALPFTEHLWARRRYHARLEPEHAELWISADKGSIEPGAREFPFALFFRPSDSHPLETTLVVEFGDFETRTRISASRRS
jgi:hypothetical protein